jgi:hypothetical protein
MRVFGNVHSIPIQSFQCLLLNDDLYIGFSNFLVENPDSRKKVEQKHAFTFNTGFKGGHCADDSEFQKFVSFTPVFSDKPLSESLISCSSTLTYF